MSSYKEEICLAMNMLSDDPKTCCIGYNVLHSRAGGTLNGFDPKRLHEMPLAENLLVGAAIGLSLDGWTPLAWIERSDFLLCCMDALYNHLARISELSQGIHNPACIIRVAVGNKEAPLFTGVTHTQDYSDAMIAIGTIEVIRLTDKEYIAGCYAHALKKAKDGESTILVEYRDLMAS